LLRTNESPQYSGDSMTVELELSNHAPVGPHLVRKARAYGAILGDLYRNKRGHVARIT
jgi:hypothetical protein